MRSLEIRTQIQSRNISLKEDTIINTTTSTTSNKKEEQTTIKRDSSNCRIRRDYITYTSNYINNKPCRKEEEKKL